MKHLHNFILRFSLLCFVGLLAACANPMEPVESEDMVGPGRGTDDYKLSPCTCEDLQLAPVDQDTINALAQIYG